MKKYLAIILLILSNLLPLLGILFWGWKLFDILSIYWLESLVIVIYNGFKINKTSKLGKNQLAPSYFSYIYLYSMLAGVWLLLLCIYFGPLRFLLMKQTGEPLNLGIIWVLLFLILSHGISYRFNFLEQKEYESLTVTELFYTPIYRYIVIQMVVFFAGYMFMITDSVFLGAIVMVLLKTILDLFAHWQEHQTRENLLNYYSQDKIDKIFKRTKLIGYLFVFGPLILIPLAMILDPSSMNMNKQFMLYGFLESIMSFIITFFIIWILFLLPIGGIILIKNIKKK